MGNDWLDTYKDRKDEQYTASDDNDTAWVVTEDDELEDEWDELELAYYDLLESEMSEWDDEYEDMACGTFTFWDRLDWWLTRARWRFKLNCFDRCICGKLSRFLWFPVGEHNDCFLF